MDVPIAVTTPYTPPQRLWPATPGGVHRARHMLVGTLAEWELAELADDAALVLSELMANAQQHGHVPDREIGVSLFRIPDGVVIEVHDARPEHPVLRRAADSDEHGRGLAIVDSLTSGHWGVTPREGPGKVVWATLPNPRRPGLRPTRPGAARHAVGSSDQVREAMRQPVGVRARWRDLVPVPVKGAPWRVPDLA